ncbi:MAG: ABC transporter substrate-binding protein [Chloroflexi bacterium]|nr:ABC transporter substrate-binding protein [Chloroflexota bacterium]
MGKKILWLAVSALMALSLVLAACGPAATAPTAPQTPVAPSTPVTPTAPTTPTAPAAERPQQEAVKPAADVPKYGGTHTVAMTSDPRGWDEVITLHFWIYSNQLTHQMLLTGDWIRGPAGTGEFEWTSGTSIFSDKMPTLIESYELVQPGHIRWKIRPGMRFGLNPKSEASRLVNGRELTAEDVAFTLNRNLKTTNSYVARAAPVMAKSAVFTTPDKYTLELKVDPTDFYNAIYFLMVWAVGDYPSEVISKYGDMNKWQNVVGTGPFILTDYIPGSQVTLARNTNFWQVDPVGPGKGQRLPYVDTVRELIIPDASTRQAALRTGKIDELGGLRAEDAALFKKTTPQLESVTVKGTGGNRINFRIDKPNLPQYDVRVRRALNMAVDFDTLIKTYFSGQADMRYSWPVGGGSNIDAISKPLSERSADIQELFAYKPDKAKQLLKEAGYPNGFKIQVVAEQVNVDYLAIIKDYWQKVGVEMEIKVLESGAWTNVLNNRLAEQAIYSGGYPGYIRMGTFVGDNYGNSMMVDDPYLVEKKAQLESLFFAGKEEELDRVYRDEIAEYILSKAYVVPTPAARTFNIWWPWLKNYYGARSLGWTSWPQYMKYVWIDQDLKKAMGY